MLTDSGVFTASIYDPLDQLVDRSGDSRLSSIGFFVLYGLVIGLLAAAVGAAVGRLSYRSSRKEGS